MPVAMLGEMRVLQFDVVRQTVTCSFEATKKKRQQAAEGVSQKQDEIQSFQSWRLTTPAFLERKEGMSRYSISCGMHAAVDHLG